MIRALRIIAAELCRAIADQLDPPTIPAPVAVETSNVPFEPCLTVWVN